MSDTTKKQNFLHGATLLAVATVIVKVIGAVYKIPLQSILGKIGYSYFSSAYDIYTLLLLISTAGLPVAMSRMISQATSLNDHAQTRRVYNTSRTIFLIIGAVSTGLMMLFCRALAKSQEQPDAALAIFCLAPSAFLMSVVSTYRGFFQGQGDMRPTALSQIIEAAGKLFLGLSFAYIVMKMTGSEAYASGATIAGISIGAGLSALFILIRRRKNRHEIEAMGGTADSYASTAKRLLAIAVPITIGAAGLQLILKEGEDLLFCVKAATGKLVCQHIAFPGITIYKALPDSQLAFALNVGVGGVEIVKAGG